MQGQIPITTDLQHLQTEIDHEQLFLKALDQLQDLLDSDVSAVQSQIKITDLLKQNQVGLQIVDLLYLVEGQVQCDPLEKRQFG